MDQSSFLNSVSVIEITSFCPIPIDFDVLETPWWKMIYLRLFWVNNFGTFVRKIMMTHFPSIWYPTGLEIVVRQTRSADNRSFEG